jgi:cytochrome c biogenesis protein CcmG, thiol:disulfide interchange protein DsbE
MTARRNLLMALAALTLLGSVASGCGSSSGGDYGGQHPDYATALAGSPPPLAALHKQADELLPGGKDVFEKRIAALKGYPVVANLWASWCDPCRREFPTLQKLSARYGKQVAFLGVNSQDSDDAAATFLAEAPLSYPSYTDPGGDVGIL